MPRDPRLDRLADVLVTYSTGVKPGDVVGVAFEPAGWPLATAVIDACVRAGGDPFPVIRRSAVAESLLTHGTDEQLARANAMMLSYVETIDVNIVLLADENTRSLSRFDPARVARFQQGARPTMQRSMERAAAGKLRWCGTQMPTQAAAQDAEMSLAQYEEFVFGAGLLDHADPVAAWRAVHERQERVRERLQGRSTLRFRAPACDGHDGTDLVVDVAGSTWINCSGRQNFPDGEVFAGPRGADGHVNYTFPAVYNGREAAGVRLAFKEGRVVDATATRNEEFLIRLLDQDSGARTLGEIAIGTNYGITEFSRNTLFDEKIGGTFHAAVGAGYPESGNSNQSGLHWDMVCDLRPRKAQDGNAVAGGTIECDGELIQRDGKFLIPGW
ncbi:MAG TPA: aminopeptidase [Phycisphaerales bacterium]|nr:aminopeptidase [Phycisphaerales bacterium]HMP36232.1 aminopeptidase [Phycisphaerales bacterium]